MAEISEYSSHDFSSVNRHIDQVARRDGIISSSKRAVVFAHYAKYIFLLLVGLGVAALLIFWGISLLIEKPQPEVITKEVVVKEPVEFKPTIVVQNPNQTSPVEQVRKSASERLETVSSSPRTSANSASSDVKPIYNFTIFKQIPFNEGSVKTVTVGMNYKNSSAKKPNSQWCYVLSPNGDGTETWITLSNKNLSGTENKVSLTNEMMRKTGLSSSQLRRAQNLCAYE